MTRRKRPSPDWAEYSLYADLDAFDPDERSCESLPEMCGGTIPGWKYDGYCECGSFLLWQGESPEIVSRLKVCTKDSPYERN